MADGATQGFTHDRFASVRAAFEANFASGDLGASFCATLEGETVVRCIPHIGYLHSGFEKLGEYRHYNQIIPLTDRTDYLSPMANNVCLALAAEKLMGIEITERCQVLRVIACEMSRIISHLVWLGTTGIDLGAFTPFL